jgi:hypothetical protein
MPLLVRITTEYIDAEDRIVVRGEVEDDHPVMIWLTCRLLDRLIPHLCLWLEKRYAHLPSADVVLGFAQQEAQGQLVPQPPVEISGKHLQWLVTAVDLQPGDEQIRLVFKGEDSRGMSVDFAATPLRQWLAILHHAYGAAQWPEGAWPGWMTEHVTSAQEAVVLH